MNALVPLSLMRPGAARFDWTDEAVETLRGLCAEGYSASQIAFAMGILTRSAVIGKASRLGFNLHGKQTNMHMSRAPRLPRREPPRNGKWTWESKPSQPVSLASIASTLRPTSPGARVGRGVRMRSDKCAKSSDGGVESETRKTGNKLGWTPRAETSEGAPGFVRAPALGGLHKHRAGVTPGPSEADPFIGIEFVEIKDGLCRWPQGDPQNLADFRFCGVSIAVEAVYCPCHARRAFNGTAASYAKSTERNKWLMKA